MPQVYFDDVVSKKFKSASDSLYLYLNRHFPAMYPSPNGVYHLYGVLEKLQFLIIRRNMIDLSNQSIIICDKELEEALNVKYLHYAEVREYANQHFINLENICTRSSLQYYIKPNVSMGDPPKFYGKEFTLYSGSPMEQAVYAAKKLGVINPTAKFSIKTPLLSELITAMRTEHQANPLRIFTYQEVCQGVSRHILLHKSLYFDVRNVRIINVKNTTLQTIFKVTTIHRQQITTLIKSQLIPFPSPSTSTIRAEREIYQPSRQLVLAPSSSRISSTNASTSAESRFSVTRRGEFEILPLNDEENPEFLSSSDESEHEQEAMEATMERGDDDGETTSDDDDGDDEDEMPSDYDDDEAALRLLLSPVITLTEE